jgi:hypothetical protein
LRASSCGLKNDALSSRAQDLLAPHIVEEVTAADESLQGDQGFQAHALDRFVNDASSGCSASTRNARSMKHQSRVLKSVGDDASMSSERAGLGRTTATRRARKT